MTGGELLISDVRSDHSTSCANGSVAFTYTSAILAHNIKTCSDYTCWLSAQLVAKPF